MSKINELFQEIKELEEQRSDLLERSKAIGNKITSLRFLMLKEIYGITTGTKVKYGNKLYAVSNIRSWDQPYETRKPWLTGFYVRKDGVITNIEYNLYWDWELVPEEQ